MPILDPPNLLVVLGPTASGKTHLAVQLARRAGAEIISADSRQVYRGLDIGSGKDLDEYSQGGAQVSVHLIDVVDLDEEFNVFAYQKAVYELLEDLRDRDCPAIVAGGSGLYLEAVLKGYTMVEVPIDPALRTELEALGDEELRLRLQGLRSLHNTTDIEDRQRLIRAVEIAVFEACHEPEPAPTINALILGVRHERKLLRERIYQRLTTRLEQGLIEEVEGLLQRGVSQEKLRFLGLEYRFVAEYLSGEIKNENDLKQKLNAAICAFAKRQETWFRRMQRRGAPISWVEGGEIEESLRIVGEAGGFGAIEAVAQ